jgi:ClpP class serine protease
MADMDRLSETTAERTANALIERELDTRLRRVEDAARADVLTYIGPMYKPADDAVKDALEAITPKRRALLVILESAGGYVFVAERMAQIFRHHYTRVDFWCPHSQCRPDRDARRDRGEEPCG